MTVGWKLQVITLGVVLGSASMIALTLQAAAQAPAGLQSPFESKAGTIITGLGSIVTATQQPLATNYLSQYRTVLFRSTIQQKLIDALAANPFVPKLKPFAGTRGTSASNPTAETVLCAGRGSYEVLASEAAYLNTVAQTLTNLQKPEKANNIVDAIVSVFNQTPISIPDAKKNSKDVVDSCHSDLEGDWPKTYYIQPGRAEAAGGILDLFPLYSQLDTLFNVASAIFSAFRDYQQKEQINAYLLSHKSEIEHAAKDLVAKETALFPELKAYAIGQFVDRMSNLAALTIDLSNIAECKQGAAKISTSGKDVIAGTDDFASCYAQVWLQASAPLQAAITSAASYDSLAQVSPEANKKINSAVTKLMANYDLLAKGETVNPSALFTDVTQIIVYGQQIQKAFPSSSSGSTSGSKSKSGG